MSDPTPEPIVPPAPPAPEPVPAPTPDQQPGDDDEQAAVVDDEPDAAGDASRNTIEEFVKTLPEGYAICPTCLALGAVVEDPPFDPHTKTCPDCNGHTRTRTGALTGNEVERPCTTCNQRGWVPRDVDELPASPARASDFAGDRPPVDSHGRTPADADFDWTAIARDVEPLPLQAVE